MNSQFPKRTRLAIITLTLALLLAPLSSVVAQQKKNTETPLPSVGSPINAIIDLSSSVLNSAAGYVDVDPYSQFRDARYSNEGLLSESDEMKLGNEVHKEVGKKFKLTTVGQARANRIGQRAARASQRANITYQFHVVQEKEINAFATPGGHIYVTTGLMNMANDDELASVLAHEVGHVVARHSLKTMQQSQMLGGLVDLVGSVTGIAGNTAKEMGTLAAQVVGSGLLATHNREEEREADFLGVRTMSKAGFNVEGMVTMFQKIQRISNTNRDLLGAIFADHPDVDERIENTRYEIKRMRGRR
jgi:predicted Zn-dependent protease